MTDKAWEIVYNIFCVLLVIAGIYLAYKYIYLDYLTWMPEGGK